MRSPFGRRSRSTPASQRRRRREASGSGSGIEPLEQRRLLAADSEQVVGPGAWPVGQAATAAARSVVLIDSGLVAAIPREELAGSLVVAIDGSRDAVGQITTALAGLAEIDTLRLISHGSDGSLWFGGQGIDAATLDARAIEVAGWGRALSADGDILLYGCSVASTAAGRQFVQSLATLTGGDVAASSDRTGAGGDQTLEVRVGDVGGGLLADAASYERSGLALEATTRNSRITNWTNNMDGTATVTMTFDLTGQFYYAGGYLSDRGYVYMYHDGDKVAEKYVTAGNGLTITARFPLHAGTNEISVSARYGFPTTWTDPDPHEISIQTPYFLGMPSSLTVPVGQWQNQMYVVSNAFGTPTIRYSATNLPRGVTIDSRGVILGIPETGTAGVYNVVVSAFNGFGTANWPIAVTIFNQAPTFAGTSAATVSGATEGRAFTITHATLASALDESDPNNDPISFRIESVLGGTLTKNGAPVTGGSTTVAANESLVWTPPPTANGTLDAFTVKAFDGGLLSAATKTVRIAVAAVNDPPTLTQFVGSVATGNEDAAIAVSFAALAAAGNEADIDGTVTAFVVKAVTGGTLRIGTSEATATAWDATSNNAVTSTLNAYWTPAANANGVLAAFTAVARDNGGLESEATPVQALVTVTPVNDPPTLTSVAILSGASGSLPFEIAYASLASAANAADIDGDPLAFRIEAVSTGTLEKWTGSAWAAVAPGSTLVAAGERLRWTPVAGSSGLRDAFTVRAWDGQAASATAVQVRVDSDRWRVVPWTDAASTGISAAHRYTHAASFGAAGSFSVGGLAFTGIAGGNPAVAGSLATTGFSGVVTNDSNSLADATRSLANDAISTSATSATVTLRGLVPGGRYVLSLYTVGSGTGDRLATLSSAMGQITVNQNALGNDNGQRIDYEYLADASGSVTIALAVPSGSFSLYGLANREYAPVLGIFTPANLTYDGSPKTFGAYATATGSLPFASAGTLHSAVLNADGTVSAFGSNQFGQTTVPAGLSNAVAVSAGGYHTLALKSDGTVAAWGNNYGGQSTVPAGLTNVVAISAGGSHNLALRTDGTVVAWGDNGLYQCNVPVGLTGVVAISAGDSHSMALKADGTVVAWGRGLYLGNNYYYDYATPPAGLSNVVAISAGSVHSLALKADGTVVAWGNTSSGQANVPVGLGNVVAVAAGGNFSMALKADGTLVSWGDWFNYGTTRIPANLSDVVAIEAGSEHSVALKADGTVVTLGWTRFEQQYITNAVGSLVQVASGTNHGIGLKTDGTVITWGANYLGQLNVPAGLADVKAVAAGDNYSAAVKTDGTVVVWGSNQYGVCNVPAGLTGVVKIVAARYHIVALKADGTVVAWGSNAYSQTAVPAGLTGVVDIAANDYRNLAVKADGTVVPWGYIANGNTYVPPGLSGVKAVACGFNFSVALKTDGTVVAWGENTRGQTNVPVGLTNVVAIATDFEHALALTADGRVVAWGYSPWGETTVPASTIGTGVVAIAAGSSTSYALKSDGTVIGWGLDAFNNQPPAVGLPGRLVSTAANFTGSYAGRNGTVYPASSAPPTAAGDYTFTATAVGTSNVSVRTFTIAKATPSVAFNPSVATIAYGTPLGSQQLNASAFLGSTSVAGTMAYSSATGTVLPVGTHTITATFTPTDSANFNPAVRTATITVTTASVAAGAITLTPPASLVYNGSAKAYTASATGVGSFTYSYSGRGGTAYGPSSTAPTYAGDYTVTATVSDPSYVGTKSLDFTIAKATPTITTAPTAAPLTFSQTLASSALSGGAANVPGSFAWADTSRMPYPSGSSETVVFTPTDTVNYTTTTGSTFVAVSPLTIAAGAFTFSSPSSLVYNGSPKMHAATAAGPWGTLYGMAYSYTGVGGTTYGPSATAPTNAGSYAVTATLTGTNFTGSATRTFTIAQLTPTVTWAAPAPISYGTALSATQLNATAGVAGSFTYTPAIGTVLAAGGRTLQAVFTPTDTANYTSVTATVPLQVNTTSLPISLLAPPGLTYDGTAKRYVVSQNAYLSAGSNHVLALKADGTVVAWGRNNAGQTNVPAGLSGVIQVSAGYSHSVALKSNGTLVAWGDNGNYQYSGYPAVNLPYTGPGWTPIYPLSVINDASAVAAGGLFTAVLRSNGTVTVLGDSAYVNAVNVPVGLSGVTAIAAGYHHALALKSDGTVVAWGSYAAQDYGQATVPAGLSDVVAVAAGFTHSLALKSDGTVVAWGNNSQGQSNVPAGLTGVVAITAGFSTSYAIKADGTVVGWGDSYSKVVPAAVTGVAALAQGSQHAVAIKTDGSVAAWGRISNADGSDLLDAASFVPSPLTGVGNFSSSTSYVGRAGTTYAASSTAPTNAGSYTVSVTSTDPNYSGGKTIDFTIAKATPTITTLPQSSILAEGQALSTAVLDGGVASVPGTFTFSAPAFVPSAGTTTQEITFTPTDSVNYNAVTRTVTVLSQGTNASLPTILSLPTASAITFGQRLEASVLSGGSASVPGTFVYSSRLTVPGPGTARQSVTFIPTDIASYQAVTFPLPLTVYDGIVSTLNIPVVPPPSLTYNGSPKAFSVSRSQLISGFYRHVLVVNADGTVTASGDNFLGGCDVPAGLTGVVAVSAGDSISLALKSDGTVVEWGGEGQWGPLYGRPPAGLSGVVAISRTAHGLALKSDGTVVAWGYNASGQCNVPAGLSNVVAIAANQFTSFALKSDGTVVSWGGSSNIPAGLSGVIAIDAAPYGGAVALKADGTVVTWDFASPPAGLAGVVAVAAGNNHMAALKADGTVVTWGTDTVFSPSGANTNLVPYDLAGVVAIAAGANQTFAVKADGSVVWWGQGSTNWIPYRVNGELYRTPEGFGVSVPGQTALSGVSANFAFTTTYAGREATAYAATTTPPTEPGDYSVTVVGTNSAFTTPKTYAFTIAKATPAITTAPGATGITYGQSLAASNLSGGAASVAGTFAFAVPATAPNAGTASQSVVFTPTDTTRYLPVTLGVPVAVARATPTLVTLPTATSITYGQSLAAAVLANGLATAAGTFAFTTVGTSPSAGSSSQGITFTPTDTANYEPFTTSVSLLVARATPTVTTPPTATSIRYGQTLADSTLSGGSASVAGTFSFADGSVAPASGTANQDVVFTPSDLANYAPVTLSVPVAVRSFASADDAESAVEAGGTANGTDGLDAAGNVLTNDTNYDGSSLAVTGIVGPLGGGTLGAAVAGLYGSLTILADGGYAYVVNNANAAVQALASGASLVDSFTYSVASPTDTASAALRITVYGANDAATFSSLGASPLAQIAEDTQATIGFAALLAAGNEADVDGTVTAFVVTSVEAGTLLIGTSAASATPWNADTNAVIDATHSAYWTPISNATGVLPAFNVVARDDGGLTSSTPVTVRVDVLPVNDPPILDPVGIAFTDTIAADTFAPVAGTLAASDIDSSVLAFGLTGVTPVAGVSTAVGSYGTLTVNAATGQYSFTPNAAAINALTSAASETFPIVVSDGSAGGTTAALLTITVAAVNDRPTFTAFAAAVKAGTEDTAVEISLADLLAAGDEADVDGTITAFVVTEVRSGQLSIGTSAANATPWNAATNAVVSASLNAYWTPDADANGLLDAFSVVARDDGGGLSTTAVVCRVSVTAVNDAPHDVSLSTSTVAENLPTGTAIGTFATSDIDAGDTFTYSLVAGTGDTDNAAFTIVGGSLRTAASFDVEARSSYTIRVRAADAGGLSFEKVFVISVTDVNEAPTAVALANTTTSIDENTSTATRIKVADIVVTDDALGSETVTLTGADAASFEVDGLALYLKAGVVLDRETKASYAVTVNVADASVSGSTPVTVGFTLTVANVNEGPTVAHPIPDQNATQDAPFSFAFAANTFADIDEGDTLAYVAQLNGGGALPAWLTFNPASRTFSGTPAYADSGILSIDVIAGDGNGGTVTDTFNVVVAAVNYAPTAVALANTTTSIDENTSITTRIKVADIVVTDDALGSETVTLTGADAASFEVDGLALYLKAGVVLDRETKASYAVTVNVADASVSGSTPVTVGFTLTVANVNEGPTVAHPIPDQNATQDAPFSFAFAANTFADIDEGDTLAYVAQLNGGGALPAWLTFNPASRTFSGTPAYADSGILSIDVIAGDGNGGTVTDTFNVVVAAVNYAPTAVALANTTTSIDENTSTATRIKVADIVVTDDALGSETVTLTGADAASFEVDGLALYVRAGVVLDRETKAAYAVTVNVADASVSGSTPVTVGFTLTVADVNEAPTSVSLTNTTTSVPENTNTATRIKVADIVVTDDALGSESITLSGADATSFEVDGLVLYLKSGASLDFETQASYAVTVNVADTSLTGSTPVTVGYSLTVTDVNEAPTGVSLTNTTTSVPENTSTATRIKVADIVVTDDALGSESITLSGADAASFEVDGLALYLKSGIDLDFEAKASYAVTVNVEDTSLTGSTPVTVGYSLTVTDVNEAPAGVALTNTTASVPENTSTATRIKVADIVVTDDALGSEAITLTGADATSFEVDGLALYVKSGVSLDFETQGSYAVTVNVADTSLTGSTPVTVGYSLTVTDVNEAPTSVSLTNTTTSIVENTDTTSRIKVADIVVTDDAIGSEMVALTGADAASFEVDGLALYLKSGVVLDFEAKTSYAVTVNVEDTSLSGSTSVTAAFTLAVTDVNETPSDIALVGTIVAENAAAGTAVGTLSTTDVDAGDAFTYTLVSGPGDADNAAFTIDGSTLKAAASFDFETKSGYTVRVRSTDSSGLFTEKAFAISVTDVNEAPTDIALAGTAVAENAAAGTAVGTLSTTDVDAGDTFTYTLVSGTGDADNAAFTIDGDTLKTAALFNFEAKSSYTVRVRSTDSGGLFTEKAFAISVTDVNEAPSDIALVGTTVAENAAAGTAVGTLSTTDVDAGATFTYTLVSGTGDADNTAFTIDGSTLKIAASFNFEAKSSYTVRVRSTDANGLFTEKAFAISVADVNEPATIGLPTPFLNEVTEDVAVDGSGFLATSGQFSVVDPDAGESSFDTTVTAPVGQSNLGQLTVAPDGTFVYKVLNSLAAVQAIRAGETVTDSFTVRSADGTDRVVSFHIHGLSDTQSGAVADGYLRNARLFADANANGLLDWADAGSLNGSWDLGEGEAWTTTDATGNFSFDFGNPTATLVTIGGVDISTNLPFLGSLQAPAGSTIVNPLTTLVAATLATDPNLSVTQAAAAVAAALSLPQNVDLTIYDPLAQAAGDATALAVQKAAAGVASVIVATATNGIDTDAALANLATLVTAPNAGPVNLQDSATLASVLTVQTGSQPTPPPTTLVAGLVLANTTIANSQSLTEIAQSQTLVQGGTPFAAPAVTSAVTAGFDARTPGSFQFTATGYPAPSFSITGTLPAGLTLTSGGLLAGTPAAGTAGSYSYTVTAANGIAPAATQAFTLTIAQSDDIVVTVDQNQRVVLSLAPRGVTITDLHTAYDARRGTLIVTAAGAGTMSGGGPGVTVNAAARTVTVRLNVFTTFAGIVVAGGTGTDSVTIGRQGVNLAAVTAGAADQVFIVSTGAGANDRITVGGLVSTKGAGLSHLAASGGGIRLGAPVRSPAGWQTYTGDVTLTTDASLTAGGTIMFGGGIDGRRSLSLAAGGGVYFTGAIGETTPLTGLSISRAATVAVGDGLALDGTGTAAGSSGLTIGRGVNHVVFSSLGSTTRLIRNFSGSGIRFLGGSRDSVLTGIVSRRNGVGLSMAPGDYRGTAVTASSFEANRSQGVVLDGTRNLVFGGPNSGGSVLGNQITGRLLTGESSTGMTIRGRAFGTLVQGNTIRHHLGDGLRLSDAQGVTIGGAAAGVGNTIAINLGAGLSVTGNCDGSTASGNTVRSNRRGNGEPPSLRGPL